VQPGHDGKLFVTALLPLALVGLVLAVRDRKVAGYGVLALSVGLALLSPHFQMTYYMLITAGIFALYLVFAESDDKTPVYRLGALAAALGAVVVGFGLGMIQILPFYEYLPFSPRAEGYYGFEGSTSYAVPWAHVPEFFLSRFVGTTPDQTYWGPNPLKLHSEYLGLAALGLAVVGALDRGRRRTVLWFSAIGLLFLLICLGSATPFYRVWWSVMPFVKQTRAPGMAFFVVALVVSLLAAFGVDRLLKKDLKKEWAIGWITAGGIIVLLALVGVLGGAAQSAAQGIQMESGRAVVDSAIRAGRDIRLGGIASGAALLLLGIIGWAMRANFRPAVLTLSLPLLVSVDLWQNARDFWTYSARPSEGLYQSDEITALLGAEQPPFRVLDLSDTGMDVYPGASLMTFDVPQLLGHHGNQLHSFNEVMGGKNEWQYLLSGRRLWELFAVRYVLLPHGVDLGSQLPAYSFLAEEYDTLMTDVEASSGVRADLLVRRQPSPYARLVPAALKVPDDQAIPNVSDPRSSLGFDQLVLLAEDAGLAPEPVQELPPPLEAEVVVESWDVGRMELRIEPAAPAGSYLVVSENYYPGWVAAVDGERMPAVRGNGTLITVPLPEGGTHVELEFWSDSYRTGRLVTWLSLTMIVGVMIAPGILRRSRSG
jgi:hypothetical protein